MTRTITPRLRTLVLLFLAVTGALLAGAGPASAHAALTGSDPSQGVVVTKAPDQVTLTFSENVSMNDNSIRVLDPKGARVDLGKPDNLSGTTYGVQLKSGLGKGTYTVAWQVVSADSHPVAGAFTFSVGTPSRTVASVGDQDVGGGVVGWLYGFGRYMSYAGYIVLVGGAAFILACWRRGSGVRAMQRLVVGGWLTLTAATLWLLLLRGSYTTSGSVGDIVDLNLLGQVLQTKTGAALVSRLLLLAAAALFIAVLFGAYDKREEGEEKRDLTFGLAIGGTVVAAGLAASWAMAEHASTGLQPGLAMPVDVVHLLAVAAWLGGLTALLVALYRAPAGTPVESVAVRRFSRVAFGSVLALVATGSYQSWRQLGSWSAFTDTTYGELLLVKIGLVALLVGIASISRRWTGRLADSAVTETEAGAKTETEAGAETAAGAAASEEAEKAKATVKASAATKEASAASAKSLTGASEASVSGASGKVASADADPDPDPDPERAAQLARQQTAMDTARQKRARDADPHRFGLRRSVLAEAGVAVVLLAVTTVLTQTEPGRTEQDAKAAASAASSSSASNSSSGALTLDMSFDTGGKDGKGVVRVDLDPATVGSNEMHVYVQRPNGRAFDIPEVKVAFTLAAKNLGPLPVAPDHVTTGHWAANGVQIPMAGDWRVSVTVRTSDIDQVTVSKNAQIG
ncbi:copper resistance CopC/CopD family protein [Streptomyces shenzhenensis]|uniref:copper resistance CopC/CopD family protein n=1 Tax=Streptomyces shenzhenensis TaxID=943815 RepID=UPI0015F028FC|nr:copper resistance protein CopC [Streptomyces shenzhenensis]